MRILLKRIGALGDVICTTPIARRLRFENPNAEIHIQTDHQHAYYGSPFIDRIIGSRDRAIGYDKIIDLTLAYESSRKVHQVEAYMMKAFGDSSGDRSFYLDFPKSAPEIDFNIDWNRVIVIHANRSWPSRTLPETFWEKIATTLIEKEFEVVMTGGFNDISLPSIPKIIDTRGWLRLSQQASLIHKARAALIGQSGMAAVAGCTDTPIISFFTITRPEFEIPYRHGELGWNYHTIKTSLPCFACFEKYPPVEYYECERKDNFCVNYSFSSSKTVETVLKAIESDQRKTLA